MRVILMHFIKAFWFYSEKLFSNSHQLRFRAHFCRSCSQEIDFKIMFSCSRLCLCTRLCSVHTGRGVRQTYSEKPQLYCRINYPKTMPWYAKHATSHKTNICKRKKANQQLLLEYGEKAAILVTLSNDKRRRGPNLRLAIYVTNGLGHYRGSTLMGKCFINLC